MMRRSRWAWIAAAAALTGLDLWSKGLFPYEGGYQRVLIDGFLTIKPIYNPGGIWSLPIPPDLLLVATALAVPLLAIWILFPARGSVLECAAKSLVLAGAAGNCVDRLLFGKVRDFLDVHLAFADYTWPTFNVADAAIVVGVGLLLIASFRRAPERGAGETATR
ncbi:MAG: signal peptidase II [Planctomycetaceae bacterium]